MTKKINKHIGHDSRARAIAEQLKEKGEIVINNGMFFLPDDFKKLKLKGKWMLYIKKGLLVRLDSKGKRKV